MQRKLLKQLLVSYKENSLMMEEEQKDLDQMLSLLENNPRCFSRDSLEAHFTGSCWIVDLSKKYCLLTHHRKLGVWLQLGGHADGDPDLFNVAKKEGFEESGIQGIKPLSSEIFDIDIHEIPERKQVPKHFHYDIRFLFEVDKDIPFIVSEESLDLAWVPIVNLEDYNSERSLLRLRDKTLQGVSIY
jgi:hypothetical protein